MLQRARRWARRHRTAIAIAGAAATAYLVKRLVERQLQELEAKAARESRERVRRKQLFEVNQTVADETIMELARTVHDILSKHAGHEDVRARLQQGASLSKQEKVQLWSLLTRTSVCLCVSAAYLFGMVTLLVCIQANIVAGLLSAENKAPSSNAMPQANRAQSLYLQYCHHFASSGVTRVYNLVLERITPRLEALALDTPLNLRDMRMLFEGCRRDVEDRNGGGIRVASLLLPAEDVQRWKDNVISSQTDLPLDEQNVVARQLQLLIDDTRDILDTQQFQNAFASAVSDSVDAMLWSLNQRCFASQGTMPMVRTVAHLCEQERDLFLTPGTLKAATANRIVSDFCRSIFEAFSEPEGDKPSVPSSAGGLMSQASDLLLGSWRDAAAPLTSSVWETAQNAVQGAWDVLSNPFRP